MKRVLLNIIEQDSFHSALYTFGKFFDEFDLNL